MPHSAAGWRIEPPVSLAEGEGHESRRDRRRATARGAARHPAGVPGVRVGPKAEFSVEEPIANSSRLVLPIAMAPASRSRRTTVAS